MLPTVARIALRRVLGGPVATVEASGDAPLAIDIPTLHAHSLENIGDGPLLSLFWSDRIHDPAAPDTYPDPVRKEEPNEENQGDDGTWDAPGNHPAVARHGTA
ncbi:MAG: hypothetical protein ACE5FS_01670 [Paracoccaceae bacterium]